METIATSWKIFTSSSAQTKTRDFIELLCYVCFVACLISEQHDNQRTWSVAFFKFHQFKWNHVCWPPIRPVSRENATKLKFLPHFTRHLITLACQLTWSFCRDDQLKLETYWTQNVIASTVNYHTEHIKRDGKSVISVNRYNQQFCDFTAVDTFTSSITPQSSYTLSGFCRL